MKGALLLENVTESETAGTSYKCERGIRDYGVQCVLRSDLGWWHVELAPLNARARLRCLRGLPDAHPREVGGARKRGIFTGEGKCVLSSFLKEAPVQGMNPDPVKESKGFLKTLLTLTALL